MSLMNASYYCLTWLSIKLLNLDRTITLSLAITVYIYMLPSLKMHPWLNFILMLYMYIILISQAATLI